ncbi:MAG: hypothetical protein ACR2HR_08610 [Euzebya sp.]
MRTEVFDALSSDGEVDLDRIDPLGEEDLEDCTQEEFQSLLAPAGILEDPLVLNRRLQDR